VNAQPARIDFARLVDQMMSDRISEGTSRPAIVGGECEADRLLDWLDEIHAAEMTTWICTYADSVTCGHEGPSRPVGVIERVRLFGVGGDLDVWRDGDKFRWRYVGLGAHAPEDGRAMPWPGTETSPVYVRERTVLLWGERQEGQSAWFDDRTAGAALTYPVPGTPPRVQARYREYTQAGDVLAVWFTGLEAYDG